MSAVRTQVYLSKEHRKRIDALGDLTGQSLADIVRSALDRYLDEAAPDTSNALTATFGADPTAHLPNRDEWNRG